MLLLARPHYYCAKFMTVKISDMQPNLPKQGCALLFASSKKNDSLTWDHIAIRNKMVRNVFLNHQFRNKTVLNGHFGNNVFHSEIGTRNKTGLTYQFRNSVFRLQIGTRNKTVLIYQFENDVFHGQIGTRNKTVLSYQFGTVRSIDR